jgi:hypothetical protein
MAATRTIVQFQNAKATDVLAWMSKDRAAKFGAALQSSAV